MKPQWEVFCRAYARTGHGLNSYLEAYPEVKRSTAKVNASRLLKRADVQQLVARIKGVPYDQSSGT